MASQAFEDRMLDVMEPMTEDMLTRLASEKGPPADAKQLTEADEDEAWDTPDDAVSDLDEFARRLAVQGIPQEEAQTLLFLKLRPEWMPLFTRPTQDLGVAQQRAWLASKPFRLNLLEDYDDPTEMTERAEQLERRAQKRRTMLQEQAMQPRMTGAGGAYKVEGQ